jgi:predicted deacetylase
MKANYLVRFDDLCPTMNWEVWSQVEVILQESGISPILAVIPDNRDESLMVSPARIDFWQEVRKWQSRGWSIGLHGHQHICLTRESGIVGISPKSEFAGLPEHHQEAKLRAAMEIFLHQQVRPQVWVAPSHSFDQATIAVLKRIGLDVISDGLAIAPHIDRSGAFWVPQQLWKFRRRWFGLWTICFHPNSWTQADVLRFKTAVYKYRGAITDLHSVVSAYPKRPLKPVDALYNRAHSTILLLRRQTRPSA